MSTKGIYIALEGADGSGTTTAARLVSNLLKAEGHSTLLIREPSDFPVGLLIREFLRDEVSISETAMAALFVADRLDQYHKITKPFLEEGGIVISDRCCLSSYVYQSLFIKTEDIDSLHVQVQLPNTIYLLDITAELAQKRRSERGEQEHYDPIEIQRKVVNNYLDAIHSWRSRVKVIDASKTKDEITSEIISDLNTSLL